MNPGSPAPQASVLIQPRLRAPSTRLLYSENINPDVRGKIINTLLKLKNNGLEEQTVKVIGFYLKHLAVNVDLRSPETVKEFIANRNVSSGFFHVCGCFAYVVVVFEGYELRADKCVLDVPMV